MERFIFTVITDNCPFRTVALAIPWLASYCLGKQHTLAPLVTPTHSALISRNSPVIFSDETENITKQCRLVRFVLLINKTQYHS